ncbi:MULTISPECIES: CdaR family transcriptional regulator [Streptomyces]|uniref:PucR family transcriptional regulator n=1 Tax=Streptomyces TaxID=1883 RepID=UPI000CD5BDFE|nr:MULTISPECIES: helix-turn-helix domain-containing protein [Streptomyces]
MHPVVRHRERRGARTRPEPVPAGSATGRGESIAVLRSSAQLLLHRLPELTDRVVELIQEHEPSYRTPPGEFDTLWEEVNRSLRHNVGCLIRPQELGESARRCSWRIGTERARSGQPLDALLHAFRLGGATVWQELVEIASARDPESMRLLVHVAGDVWNFVDEHCSVAAEAYRRSEREMAWRRDNRLRLMAEALLDGSARASELADIAVALGLPERGRYAVAAVSGTGREALRRDSGSLPLVWHHGDSTDLVVAALGESGPEALAAELAPPPTAPQVRVGISTVAEGLTAVAGARRLAEKALLTCSGDGQVALLHEQLTAALLVSSPELGTVLTERVLGPLLRLDASERDLLLDTLTAWLECDASAQRAGERLSCHRNTVLNRLRRCERLIGRSLASPRATAELSLALTARRVLGVPH